MKKSIGELLIDANNSIKDLLDSQHLLQETVLSLLNTATPETVPDGLLQSVKGTMAEVSTITKRVIERQKQNSPFAGVTL